MSKAQRGLVGDGVSEVMTKLKVTSSDGTSYSGDLLAILDVLKNMTEIFRRAYYSPSSADMRVKHDAASQQGSWSSIASVHLLLTLPLEPFTLPLELLTPPLESLTLPLEPLTPPLELLTLPLESLTPPLEH